MDEPLFRSRGRSRRGSGRQLAHLSLVLMLAVVVFETGRHSVHHVFETGPYSVDHISDTAACVMASLGAHLPAASAEPVLAARAADVSGVATLEATPTDPSDRPLRVPPGRAPPRSLSS